MSKITQQTALDDALSMPCILSSAVVHGKLGSWAGKRERGIAEDKF